MTIKHMEQDLPSLELEEPDDNVLLELRLEGTFLLLASKNELE